jgi:predicted nucleic acid-binding protein
VRGLVDTCVVAEVGKQNGNAAVKEAVAAIASANLYLSVLTVGEVAKGIALLDASKKKSFLISWLTQVENQFVDRILGVDVETARIWGELTARTQKIGLTIPTADGILAATALRHGLHVITRNTKHFEATGARILDPWSDG